MKEAKLVSVTGGAGFLGSCVTRALLGSGYRVRVVETFLHGGHGLIDRYGHPGLEIVRGDVRDAEVARETVEGASALVHLAALVGETAANRSREATWTTNHDATLTLFEAARHARVERFLFASTCSNYGRQSGDRLFTEEAPLAPLSLYAESKVRAEEHLLAQKGSPAVTVLRLATLFGLSPRPRLDLTVNEFTARLCLDRRLEVYQGERWRPYLHVRDAARAILHMLRSEPAPAGIWNVGDTRLNYKKREIAETALRCLGEGEIESVRGEGDGRDYRVSFDKIARHGFQAEITLEQGIAEMRDAIRFSLLPDPTHPRYRN